MIAPVGVVVVVVVAAAVLVAAAVAVAARGVAGNNGRSDLDMLSDSAAVV